MLCEYQWYVFRSVIIDSYVRIVSSSFIRCQYCRSDTQVELALMEMSQPRACHGWVTKLGLILHMSLLISPLKKYLRVDALSVPLSLCSKLGGVGTIPAWCSWKFSKGEFSSSHYLRPYYDFGLRLLSHTTIMVCRGSCIV